ncbi:MAG: hypothetical protein ACREGL_01255 [Alphaproteobacteria bacterium]
MARHPRPTRVNAASWSLVAAGLLLAACAGDALTGKELDEHEHRECMSFGHVPETADYRACRRALAEARANAERESTARFYHEFRPDILREPTAR